MNSSKILLIEDDDILGASISDMLHLEGYHVDWIADGEKGYQAAKKEIHDLIILDIMLPKMNGLQILEELRKSSDMPVLILSAKSQTEDKVKGLQLKADDYLGKPFHLEELLLRISSILRRSKSSNKTYQQINIGESSIDFNQRIITSIVGEKISLSEKESDILRLLVANEGKILSRDEILDRVWGGNEFPSPRTVDNFIVKIRKLIEPDNHKPKFILSQRGVGYGLKIKED